MASIKIRIPAELLEVYKRGGSRPGIQFDVEALTARRILTLADGDHDLSMLSNPERIHRAVIACTAAEMLAFHSVRKTLIPAVPGYAIYPDRLYAIKPAGPAFTLGAAGNPQGKWATSGFTAAAALVTGAGFLDQTTLKTGHSMNGGAATLTGDEANAADIAGKALVSGTAGNVDYTGTGSPVTFVILYRLIPTSVATFPTA